MTIDPKDDGKVWKLSALRRSPTVLVFLPFLIASHWGWHKMQENFVPKGERVDMPIVEIYKKFVGKKEKEKPSETLYE